MSVKTLTPRIDAGIIKRRTEPVLFVYIAIAGGIRKCTRGPEEGDLDNLPQWNGITWAEGVRVGPAKPVNGKINRSIFLDNFDRALTNDLLALSTATAVEVKVWITYGAPPWAVADARLEFDGVVVAKGNIFNWAELICSTQPAQNKATPFLRIPAHMTQYAPRPGTVIRRNGDEYRVKAS